MEVRRIAILDKTDQDKSAKKTGDTLIHAEQKRLTKKDVDWLEHDRPYK